MRLWDLITTLSDIVLTLGSKLWDLLTTPVATLLENWDLPAWLELIVKNPLTWLFGSNGTLLSVIPVFIVIILLVRFVLIIFGR